MARSIPRWTTLLGLLLSVQLVASNASALGWPEVGDAGDLLPTAQDTVGNGSLDFVSGTIFTSIDKDMYRINIVDPINFSANVAVGGSLLDTQVFLFDSLGSGIYANDDPNGINQLSNLPAGLAAGPTVPGIYYIAISGPDNDPTTLGGEIFDDLNPGVQIPVLLGGISGWSPTVSVFGGIYQIDLVGAEFATAAVPSLGDWGFGLLILGLAAGSSRMLRTEFDRAAG